MNQSLVGHAVMITDKESNNDGNIGVVKVEDDVATVSFSFFSEPEEFEADGLIDMTYELTKENHWRNLKFF